jgi:hypothetical protein
MANDGSSEKIRSVPNLVRREGLAGLVSLCVVCLLAAMWDAPLQGPADPAGMPPDHVKAPWIFVGIQFMLYGLPSVIAGIFIPFAALVAITGIPLIGIDARVRTAAVSILFFGLFASALALTLLGYLT